jgi:ankyrin repeat protein
MLNICGVLIIVLVLYGCTTTTPMQKLQSAISTNDTVLAKSAIEEGASENKALIIASKKNAVNMTEFLLNNGALADYYETVYDLNDVYIVDGNSKNEYKISVNEFNGSLIIKEANIEDGKVLASIEKAYYKYDFKKVKGPNALHYAIVNANVRMVEILLNKGADVNTEYAIEGAKFSGPFYGLSEMLEAGIQINQNSNSGWIVCSRYGEVKSNILPFPAKMTTITQEAKKKNNAAILKLIENK